MLSKRLSSLKPSILPSLEELDKITWANNNVWQGPLAQLQRYMLRSRSCETMYRICTVKWSTFMSCQWQAMFYYNLGESIYTLQMMLIKSNTSPTDRECYQRRDLSRTLHVIQNVRCKDGNFRSNTGIFMTSTMKHLDLLDENKNLSSWTIATGASRLGEDMLFLNIWTSSTITQWQSTSKLECYHARNQVDQMRCTRRGF